jgi:hypothetical protein
VEEAQAQEDEDEEEAAGEGCCQRGEQRRRRGAAARPPSRSPLKASCVVIVGHGGAPTKCTGSFVLVSSYICRRLIFVWAVSPVRCAHCLEGGRERWIVEMIANSISASSMTFTVNKD